MVVVPPVGTTFDAVKTLSAPALPVQYNPAYIIFEQLGTASFSVDRDNVDDDEFQVLLSVSTSTYIISSELVPLSE